MAEHFVYGLHAVKALLNNPHRQVYKLYILQERLDRRMQELVDLAMVQNLPIEKLPLQKMKEKFADFSHQGVVATASPIGNYNEADLTSLLAAARKPGFILILDTITDPHNLGACLRTADAAGVDFVIIPKDKTANITPAVSKVACGAAESIPLVRVTNLVRAMEIIKQEGVWIYGAAGEASKSIYEFDLKGTVALVLGNEAEGLRRLTREHCDDLFALPMYGTVESLNVSVAAGISLYEVLRQRRI